MQNIYTDFVSVDKYAQDHLGQIVFRGRDRTGPLFFV